jgi:nickel-dependent lactate racemase
MVELPFGRAPYYLDLAGYDAEILRARELPTPRPAAELIDEALNAPIRSAMLHDLVSPGARVTIIVSDATRLEPRAAFLEAVERRLPDVRWTMAIATGTHGPASLDLLELPRSSAITNGSLVNHDGHRDADLVDLGTTARGTRIRVHRCVIEADLIIATGCIRPHYFAGFGAGVKAIFPGLGFATDIRANHRFKTDSGARAGVIDGNPCRTDLEDAVSRVRTPIFLINGVCGPRGDIQAVVAGHLAHAFRAGVSLARPWFSVRAHPAPLVIASDALPIAASLYQAAKIAAAAAPLVAAGGTLVVAAECADGIEPLDVVNEAIFRIGVLPRLAPGVSLVLVSCLDEDTVSRTLLTYAPTVESQLAHVRTLVLPNASALLCEVA